eukprot:TRINITY_DN419_c1_g1_i1.p1 TRINITY_DN419_c1_g1~~TRINITY_DN419_c1_g1_i1.p1  ORF type:complete len:142 (+),score=44.71 TRINITY_DN419_c1_g1_i1:54-428(+)
MAALRYLLLSFVASVLAKEEDAMSEMAFQMIDTDKNGKITKRETKAFMNGMGAMMLGEALGKMSADEKKTIIDDVFLKLDTDKDKKISKSEAKAGAGFVQELAQKFNLGGGDDGEDEEDEEEEH